MGPLEVPVTTPHEFALDADTIFGSQAAGIQIRTRDEEGGTYALGRGIVLTTADNMASLRFNLPPQGSMLQVREMTHVQMLRQSILRDGSRTLLSLESEDKGKFMSVGYYDISWRCHDSVW